VKTLPPLLVHFPFSLKPVLHSLTVSFDVPLLLGAIPVNSFPSFPALLPFDPPIKDFMCWAWISIFSHISVVVDLILPVSVSSF